MALNLKPMVWNWPPLTRGDTYPASNIVETESTADLARVRIKIKTSGSSEASITLDSDTSGVTINNATAGSWDFDIDVIAASTTSELTAGFYSYDMEITDSLGQVRTEFTGSWKILTQSTD